MRFFTSLLLILTFAFVYAVFFIAPPLVGLGYLSRLALLHIPLAWVSVMAFLLNAWWAFRYLKTRDLSFDQKSSLAARLGFIFTILATGSGMIFARLTWGSFWNFDPRETTILLLLLIYGAYLIVRLASCDVRKRAKLAAIYALFAVPAVPFLVFIVPRFYFSLHPSPLIQASGRVEMDPLFLAVLAFGLCYLMLLFCWLFKKLLPKNGLGK